MNVDIRENASRAGFWYNESYRYNDYDRMDHSPWDITSHIAREGGEFPFLWGVTFKIPLLEPDIRRRSCEGPCRGWRSWRTFVLSKRPFSTLSTLLRCIVFAQDCSSLAVFDKLLFWCVLCSNSTRLIQQLCVKSKKCVCARPLVTWLNGGAMGFKKKVAANKQGSLYCWWCVKWCGDVALFSNK